MCVEYGGGGWNWLLAGCMLLRGVSKIEISKAYLLDRESDKYEYRGI